MSKYIISFVAILTAFFFVFSTRTDLLSGAANEKRIYQEYLSSAVSDSSDAMKETMKGDSAVPEKEDRKAVEDRFFKTLAINMGYRTDDEMERLRVMVPALIMVDYDGYYVSYNRKSEDGSRIERIDTDIIPWSVNTNGYLIRYRLDDNITVTSLDTGKNYTGNYMDVADAIPDDAVPSLHSYGITRHRDHVSDNGTVTENTESEDITSDNDRYFHEKRNESIIPAMEKSISYYISQSNTLEGRNEGYIFSMPETEDTDWQRTLSGPTVMAFMQGMRMNGQNRYLNIYALSGGTITKKKKTGFILANNVLTFSGNADLDGYVPGGKAAALYGAEAAENSADYAAHHHWGSDIEGTGCYGEPVYHIHTAACYSTIVHRHTDISGNIPDDSEFIYDKLGNKTDIIKTEYGGPGSCYTIPVYHHHTDDCYHDLVHQHNGDPVNGGGCYTTAIYHHHTAACYAAGTDVTVYPETKKIYHTHVQPVFYYKEIGGNKEYSSKEAYRADGIDDDDVYISRADVSAPKACYDAVYSRQAYLVKGTRTLTIDAEYSDTGSYIFNAPVTSKYRVSIGNGDSFHEDVTLNKNESLNITVGSETNVTKEDGTVVITTGASGKQMVKITLVDDYKEDVNFSDPPMYNIDVTEFDEDTGDGKYTGKTSVYSEYEGGKDRIGEWNYDCTAERKKSQDIKITERAGRTSSTGKNAVNEGYIFTDIELTCGKSCTDVDEEIQTGQPVTVHQKGELICGKTETMVDHYELGCGYIDIHSDGKVMQQYNKLKDNLNQLKAAGASNAEINEAAGKLNDMASYILNHSITGTETTCGYTENEQIGWRLGCGKKDGAVESQTLTCGKTETTIDHYKLNCGLKDGEMIPADIAAEKNQH